MNGEILLFLVVFPIVGAFISYLIGRKNKTLRDYFAAFDISNWHIKPTENTYTIHHMNASWSSKKKKLYFSTIKAWQRILGIKGYDKLKGAYDKLKKKG